MFLMIEYLYTRERERRNFVQMNTIPQKYKTPATQRGGLAAGVGW
jgi:hypothetical protein